MLRSTYPSRRASTHTRTPSDSRPVHALNAACQRTTTTKEVGAPNARRTDAMRDGTNTHDSLGGQDARHQVHVNGRRGRLRGRSQGRSRGRRRRRRNDDLIHVHDLKTRGQRAFKGGK